MHVHIKLQNLWMDDATFLVPVCEIFCYKSSQHKIIWWRNFCLIVGVYFFFFRSLVCQFWIFSPRYCPREGLRRQVELWFWVQCVASLCRAGNASSFSLVITWPTLFMTVNWWWMHDVGLKMVQILKIISNVNYSIIILKWGFVVVNYSLLPVKMLKSI